MNTTLPTGTNARFSIGLVLGRTFRLIGRNFLGFATLAALVYIPEIAIEQLEATGTFIKSISTIAPEYPGSGYFMLLLLKTLISGALPFILQAAFIETAISEERSALSTIRRGLGSILQSLGPLAAIGFIATLPTALTEVFRFRHDFALFALLAVPEIALSVAWAVVVPAFIDERRPIFDAFSRSWRLTRGHRWPVFGVIVVYNIASRIVVIASNPLIVASTWGSKLNGTHFYDVLIVSAIVQITLMTFRSTLACEIYSELRSIKEGPRPEEIVSIFE
jgi:hypothetical protein